ncbi:MAG: hypothetical protein K0M45_08260 [Candidatus Paracaedibacteraceae bacterium]|nr:hypothetical protein [Candidatus Paracaedibacteraceae bacterium]
MAKHVAYPLIVASIFFKVTADSAVALEKNGAIFNKGTLLSENSQEQSIFEQQHLLKSSEPLEFSAKPEDQTEIIVLAEGRVFDFDFLPFISNLVLPSSMDPMADLKESQPSPCKKRRMTSSLETVCTSENGQKGEALETVGGQQSLDRGKAAQLHEKWWQENNIKKRPRTKESYIGCFEEALLEGVYRSPISDPQSGNTHYFRRGMTPKKDTPRRKRNLALAREGKAPLWVNPVTDKIEPYEMHHLGQANSGTLIVQVTKPFHKHSSMHMAGKKSEINRSAFTTEKSRVRRVLGEEWENITET